MQILTSETAVRGSAWGAISSVIWLPAIEQVSYACSIAAPMLGVFLLILQIYYKVRNEQRALVTSIKDDAKQ